MSRREGQPDETHAAVEGDWATAIVGVLEEQRELVDALVPLAERQGGLVTEGRSEDLMELLARRQAIVDRLLVTDRTLARLTEALPERWEALAEDRRRQVQDLASEIDVRLARVLQRDQEDQGRLQAVRDERRRELGAADAGRQAYRAYRRPHEAGSRFADERG